MSGTYFRETATHWYREQKKKGYFPKTDERQKLSHSFWHFAKYLDEYWKPPKRKSLMVRIAQRYRELRYDIKKKFR